MAESVSERSDLPTLEMSKLAASVHRWIPKAAAYMLLGQAGVARTEIEPRDPRASEEEK